MRLGPLFVCVRACMRTRPRVCVSVYERERLRYEGGCMWVGVWEVVIWCMGVVMKADRMRIVIILVPSI